MTHGLLDFAAASLFLQQLRGCGGLSLQGGLWAPSPRVWGCWVLLQSPSSCWRGAESWRPGYSPWLVPASSAARTVTGTVLWPDQAARAPQVTQWVKSLGQAAPTAACSATAAGRAVGLGCFKKKNQCDLKSLSSINGESSKPSLLFESCWK